jgi:hypothetical protein
MAILSGDIKLVASQVMDDVPEGGGAPTASIINDGTSNGIFPDISELDRAGGRVNLRKVFGTVRTVNTDGFFGANAIVADPPEDPLVSVTLFDTDSTFDTREEAKSRIESYLARGTGYPGYLFGDAIAGQMAISLLQRNEVVPPVVGDTLVLVKNIGLSNEFTQFVRVTDVSVISRTFTDTQGDFGRTEVVLSLSDSLREDFPGFDALRNDSSINYTGKTRTYNTIVADAARYYGVVPLESAASIGDFVVQAEDIFTQLVPSTRVEVPISDARMNQQLSPLVSSGDTISRTLTLAFSTTQALYIGGAILPGSLSISRSGTTLLDKGGLLQNAGITVGTVDYDNGIVTLSTNVFGTTSGAHTVVYTPAAAPTAVSETLGIPVTQQGQRLTYTVTLDPVPARRTLQVSYRALGRWYVLTEDGAGALRGSDASFGAGTLNYSTGTVSLTLGALPDVDSRVILAWVPSIVSQPVAVTPDPGPQLPMAFGTFVVVGTDAGVQPGTLTITWNDGTARSATDVDGILTGDATGAVDYGSGEIEIRPNTLPPKGTAFSILVSQAIQQLQTVSAFLDGGSNWTFNLTTPIKLRSVELAVVVQYPMREYPGVDVTKTEILRVFDNGGGQLQVANITNNLTVGSINYTTGACTLTKSIGGYQSNQPVYVNRTPLGASDPSSYIKLDGYEVRSITLSVLNGPGLFTLSSPSWAWWTGSIGGAARARFAGANGASAQSFGFTLNSIFLPEPDAESFNLGSDYYVRRVIGGGEVQTIGYIRNPSPTSGEGTQAGTFGVLGGSGGVLLDTWTAGTSSAPVNFRGAVSASVSGTTSQQLVDAVTFRTAIAPLLNGGFNLVGTWGYGTETFNVVAGNDGTISSGTAPVGMTPGSYGVFGVVDYETGVVDLRFGRRVPESMASSADVIDISSLGLSGITYIQSRGVQSDTLRYNAVGYSYLPLDPDILGLDPVRLPADGRVPIFRPGSFAVIGNTGTVGPVTVSNAQVINCGRTRLSRVRVVGNDNQVIDTGYTVDLDTGLVTFTNVTGYSQPVRVEHRVEDMLLVSDAQINGQISFTRAVSHNYPVPGSYVSSALVVGDKRARVSTVFDQATWTNVWSDDLIGSQANATFNDVANPITVNNLGALTERWAVQFTSSTNFQVLGENVGVIAIGSVNADVAPINPSNGQPYFTIPSAGWGLGWATGNVLRFNTVGAEFPMWVVRTIQQGPETVPDDAFTLLIRGDVDNP